MKYVVARPFGELSKIYIVSEGTDIDVPFESWALCDGKQILFATVKMHKVLQSQHFAGSYDKGAMYAYTYPEMCAVLTSHLGPSDRERYEAGLKGGVDQTLIRDNLPHDYLPIWTRTAYVLWKTLTLIVKVCIKVLSVLLFLVIVPFILKWFNGFNK